MSTSVAIHNLKEGNKYLSNNKVVTLETIGHKCGMICIRLESGVLQLIKGDSLTQFLNHSMKISDVVVPISSNFQLASGCSRYTHAIVVSELPFVLASDQGDMRWESTVKPEHFNVVGTAQESTMKRCLHRAIS